MRGLMDLASALDSGDIFGNSKLIQDLIDTTGFNFTISIVYLVILIGAFYAFYGFVVMYTGRKAGLEKDWMAFVPLARTVYRLKIVEEQWWKMFFLEWTWLYAWLLQFFIRLISNGAWNAFGSVLATLLLLCAIGYNVYYRHKFYKAFGINPTLALTALSLAFWQFPVTLLGAWAFGSIATIFDILIAYTDLFEFGGEGMNRRLKSDVQAAMDPGRKEKPRGGSVTGLNGMYANQDFNLADDDELIIGRDAQFSNIILDQNADKVSRKHCGIVYDAARACYRVTDYSTNGTFIDGGSRLVANVPTTLQKGTIIALGSRENRFKLN